MTDIFTKMLEDKVIVGLMIAMGLVLASLYIVTGSVIAPIGALVGPVVAFVILYGFTGVVTGDCS